MKCDYLRQNVIPLSRPYVAGHEARYVLMAATSGRLGGDGPFAERASALLSGITAASTVLLTSSGTHALELSTILLDLPIGSEVIVPSFTFTSTANAIVLRGNTPVFVDCRPDTLNLDERLVEAAITDRTGAIVLVHYGGVSCDMERIRMIAERHRLPVVEDNAHGLGGTYRSQPLGSLGVLAAQSFHVTKNVQCGEGGALLINDSKLVERAEIVREKGTNRNQFLRGVVDRYRWVDIGSSYLMSELQAAFLTAQLEEFGAIQLLRLAVWNTYHDQLASWAAEYGIAQPTVPVGCFHPAHIYYLLLPDLASRQAMIRHLAAHGIQAAFHFQPLHLAPAGLRYGRCLPGGCPITEQVADRLIRLPLYAGMSEAEVARVVDAVTLFRPTIR